MSLLIIDKNSIVQPIGNGRIVTHYLDQKLMLNVAEKMIAHFRNSHSNYSVAVISNQACVKSGNKTLSQAIKEMHYCLELIADAVQPVICKRTNNLLCGYFCPDDGSTCYCVGGFGSQKIECYSEDYRLPGSGMIRAAIESWEICNFENTDDPNPLVVGNTLSRQAAADAGVRFMHQKEWRKVNKENATKRIPKRSNSGSLQ